MKTTDAPAVSLSYCMLFGRHSTRVKQAAQLPNMEKTLTERDTTKAILKGQRDSSFMEVVDNTIVKAVPGQRSCA